jgi:uncharacterized Zn finger protein
MPGLIRGVARTAVVAGTASAVAGRVNHRQQEKWAAQDQQQYAEQQQQYAAQQQYAPPPPPPAPAAGPSTDMIEQLKQLGALHDQGILTDEEFSAAKAKVLGI